jgi:16S rRNA pseudouridine516 synthase
MAQIRLDKLMSSRGILSRSECKKAVKSKEITINGITAQKTDIKITEGVDIVQYNGQTISTDKYVYYMLYKPAGYVSATTDNVYPTVCSLVSDTRVDLFPVGRLDVDTTGLLLLTNDGELSHRLLTPKNHIPKTYEVTIEGMLDDEKIKMLTEGMDIGERHLTRPAALTIINEDAPQIVHFTITEGKFHQIKRMFAAVGNPVCALKRLSMGSLVLDPSLKEGEWRPLTDDEISYLRAYAKRCTSSGQL